MEEIDINSPETPTSEMESEREDDVDNALHIPDGGWGWVVCFAGFMVNFTTSGIISTNGILLLALIDLYGDTVSKTAMVGSIFMGIIYCVGPFVLLLRVFNASHRQVIICGGLVSTISTMASFFVEKVEVLYLTYGIFSGVFVGISYFSCNVIVGYYFKKKRTLAVGIAQSGSGVGICFLGYIVERSISFYGMRGTFLLISGLFFNFLVYGALCRPLKSVNKKKKMKQIELVSVKRIQAESNFGFEPDENRIENSEVTNTNNFEHPGHSENGSPTNMTSRFSRTCTYLRKIVFDPNIMKNPGMLLLLAIYHFWSVNARIGTIYVASLSLLMIGRFIQLIILNSGASDYIFRRFDTLNLASIFNNIASACSNVLIYLPAKVVNVGLNREQASLLISVFGAFFAVSQIVIGILADLIHIPTSYLLIFGLLGLSTTSFAFTFCHSFIQFVLCTSLFSIFHGFIFTLRIVLVASILGVENLDKGFSPLCFMIGLTVIIDTLITGSLFDATQSFDSIFYFITVCLLMACIISIRIIYMQRKRKFAENTA